MGLPAADLARLSTLLDEAEAVEPPAQEAWLAGLQGESARLAPALRELLARGASKETDELLDRPPAFAAPAAGPAAGDAVGPYRLLSELGRGGMGTVWLAERADGSLKRKVALKLPHLSWAPGLAERFAREREILAELQHPHIARLLDAGVDTAGRPYLALEVVDGETIDAWSAQRAAPLRQQLELLVQVADAVAYAHSRGVLHRDLKPANILVTADGQVRLLDFGVAKLMADGRTDRTTLTRAAGLAMTPAYASPEQVRGEALAATSDVYSLGLIAFELLAGKRPEGLPTAVAVPPSACSPDPLRRRALRGNLDAIVVQAMHAQAPLRYASADLFAQDLKRHLRGEPVQARGLTPWQRLAGAAERRRVPLLGSAAAIVAAGLAFGAGATALVFGTLAVATGVSLWQVARARHQAAEARRQTARAQAVQVFLEGIFDPMAFDQGDAATRQRLTAGDLLQRAAEQLAEGRIGGDLQLAVDLQRVVGRLLHDMALTGAAVALRRQRLLSLQRIGAAAALRAQALADLAESLQQQGRFDEADQRMQSALALLDGAAEREARLQHAGLAVRLATLRLGRSPDAAAMAQLEAAVARLRELAPGSAELADALALQATALSEHLHDADAAYAVAREAVALLEQRGDRRLRAALLRHRVAALLFVQRRYDEAEREVRLALATCRRIAGDGHPTTAIVAVDLARQLTIRGRLDDSLALIREFLPVLEAAGEGVAPIHLAEARMAAGEALLEAGRVAEALPALQDAVAALRHAGEAIRTTVGELLLARGLTESGRYEAALVLLHGTLQTRTELWGEAHPSTALVLHRIGATHLAAGQHEAAEEWLQRVAGSADVREHAFGSVKHRAAATRVQIDIERRSFGAAVVAATRLRDAMLALPDDQRTPALRIVIELNWLRAMLGLGRLEGTESAIAPLMAMTAHLYEGAPLRLAVRAVRTRWLSARGEVDAARQLLDETAAGYALQPLGPHFTRLLDEARAAMPPLP